MNKGSLHIEDPNENNNQQNHQADIIQITSKNDEENNDEIIQFKKETPLLHDKINLETNQQEIIIPNCQYITPNSRTRHPVTIQVNPITNEITITTKTSLIIQKLNQANIISVNNPDEYPTVLKITNEEKEQFDLLRISSIPKLKKKKCACCAIFCCNCKCSTIYYERNLCTLFLLVRKNMAQEIISEMNTSPELNELAARNRNRKLLLFVNPMSGTKQSVLVWTKVEPIFKQALIDTEVVYTERFNHAYDVIMDLDYKQYDGIITCSGDGIIHEILNAIMHRSDSKEFREKVIVGALPGGSANGFCAALNQYSHEDDQPETSAYMIIKGNHTEMDLQELESISRDKKVYSFLSLTWSMIADIDLESEIIRCCGMARATIWGAIRWTFLRQYYGAMYILPENSDENVEDIPSIHEPLDETKFIRENEQYNFFVMSNTPFIGKGIKTAPKACINDGYADLITMKASKTSRCGLAKVLMEYMDTGEYFEENGNVKDTINIDYIKTKFFRLIPKASLTDSDDVNIKHDFEQLYSVDGERYPIEPIQCKTIHRAIKVYSLVS